MKLKSISLLTTLLLVEAMIAGPASLVQAAASEQIVQEAPEQSTYVSTGVAISTTSSTATKTSESINSQEDHELTTNSEDASLNSNNPSNSDIQVDEAASEETIDSPSPASQSPSETGERQTGNSAGPISNGTSGGSELILHMNSTLMEQDGQEYHAGQPMTVKDGISYISIRSLVDRVGYKLDYDQSTKETIIRYGSNELRFKTDSTTYLVNGERKTMKGPSYQSNNVFMVPLTSITQALNLPYTVEGKKVILKLSTKPEASFKVLNERIVAGETTVIYQTQSSSPKGLPIINERWEGRQEIFETAGTYTVSYAVQDSNGEWSDPYIQTITVVNPNIPPVASFKTDKAEYRMGEPIIITDMSYDEENAIVDRQWMNNYPAFFTPGPVTIQLIVTDQHGASDKVEHTINITNETLYTEREFYELFTPVGSNFLINGGEALGYELIPYTVSTEPYTLFKDNGPEPVYTEGVLYRDTISGSTRFMIHHVNRTEDKGNVYIIAKNNNEVPASLDIITSGMAGPDVYAEVTGIKSVSRYFENYQNDSKRQTITLQPGESKIIWDDVYKISMKPGETISFLGDLYSSLPIEYTSVFVKDGNDPLVLVDTLPVLDPIQSVMRGTFTDSTRIIEPYGVIGGNKHYRISLTDNTNDPFQVGTDAALATSAINAGNYGVIYKIKLRVAPRTLITFNPRGGLYMGAALVNGNLVTFSHTGKDNISAQTSVLHRTGDAEETVEIWTTPSAGSNLPFSLLFIPLPELKQ